jgi:formylglycine-generating enzyme
MDRADTLGQARRRVKLLGPVLLVLVSSCQVVGGYESFEAQEPLPPPPPHRCDDIEVQPKPDLVDGLQVLTKLDDGTCFWIDETEVTVAQYRAFLDQAAEAPPSWPILSESCAWKTSPSDPQNSPEICADVGDLIVEELPFADQKPIRCVDWCDALAFCSWADKTLCGVPSFTGVTSSVGPNWEQACADSGAEFPYGGTEVVIGACNIGLSQYQCGNDLGLFVCGPTLVPSKSPLNCDSPNGASDMLGNVAEWTDNCGSPPMDEGPEAATCMVKGGSFDDSDDAINCQHRTANAPRSTRRRTLGFRCCAGLTNMEESQLAPL